MVRFPSLGQAVFFVSDTIELILRYSALPFANLPFVLFLSLGQLLIGFMTSLNTKSPDAAIRHLLNGLTIVKEQGVINYEISAQTHVIASKGLDSRLSED